MEQADENLRLTQEIMALLDRLGIPSALGGSMASSILGTPRLTEDADIIAAPFQGKEQAFVNGLPGDYYVSLDSIRQAIRRRASFNVIHTRSGFKLDVFVCKDRPFEQSVLARRRKVAVSDDPSEMLSLVTAEDIILLKLEWYRIGNETSERQWLDVLGVLRVQADRLDNAYLDHWAAELSVSDLLEEARNEAQD